MRFRLPALFVVLAVALVASAGLSTQSTNRLPSRSVQNPEWGVGIWSQLDVEVERSRITDHLADVERYLRRANTRSLRPDQRRARLRNLDRLEAYWQNGVFPHNHVIGDRRTPVFIDEHGTLCAVGYLMVESGHEALARRIAKSRNLARLADLAADPDLTVWLDQQGLDLSEAAMIQPTYGPIITDGDGHYDTATIIATGFSGGMIAWNVLSAHGLSDRRMAGGFGLGVGLSQMGLGVVGLQLRSSSGPDRDSYKFEHVVINLVAGAVSTVLGIINLRAGSDDATMGSEQQNALGTEWTVAPSVMNGNRIGLGFNLRF